MVRCRKRLLVPYLQITIRARNVNLQALPVAIAALTAKACSGAGGSTVKKGSGTEIEVTVPAAKWTMIETKRAKIRF
jgi:hypothetical protein